MGLFDKWNKKKKNDYILTDSDFSAASAKGSSSSHKYGHRSSYSGSSTRNGHRTAHYSGSSGGHHHRYDMSGVSHNHRHNSSHHVSDNAEKEKTVLSGVKEMFDENIGFETGALKGNIGRINTDSETLDVIRKRVIKNDLVSQADAVEENGDIEEIKSEIPSTHKSGDDYETLLDKCKPYTVDENGKDFSQTDDSLYELISVAEILKSDQLKTLDKLSKKYNIIVEDETIKNDPEETTEPVSDSETGGVNVLQRQKEKTDTFVKLTEEPVKDELSDDQKFEDYILKNNPDAVIDDIDSSIPDISDIDNSQKIDITVHDHSEEGATVKYIPVKDSEGSESHISISSTTQNIDIGKKLNIDSPESIQPVAQTEKSDDDFDDFTADEEIEDYSDIRSYIKNAALKKRAGFLSSVCSVILTIIILLIGFGYFGDRTTYSPVTMYVTLTLFIVTTVANISMFKSLKHLFTKQVGSDVNASLMSLATVLMSAMMIFKNDTAYVADVFILIILSSLILTVRSLSSFFAASARLGNLRSISTKNGLYAVDFIDDQSIAYSIAKDSVEGDILIAVPHRTNFINSFNRYSTYNPLLYGRFSVFQFIAVVASVGIGVVGFLKLDSLVGGMYCLVSMLCIFAYPSLFFINTLPCYSASRKLNKCGASVFGTAGAMQIDKANSVILSTTELFPSGTIVLKDMKVLSDNSIDDTILRAASLAESVGSTLAPIFKKIAKTDATYSLPDSDTVKYEDKLGLSGWVDNELLFIGNRTLMESHGIEVPSIEIDKRILRNGCFPVYLATVQKACALLIVKYNPDFEIAKELRKLSGLGVTLLFTNCDPNINESMISDYFDIYEDSIKIVSNAGKFMYENAVISDEPMPSPAAFKRHNLAFARIMNCASAIRKSNNLFSVIYIICSILLAVGFIYLKFASDVTFFNTKLLFVAEVATMLFSLLLYLIKKP